MNVLLALTHAVAVASVPPVWSADGHKLVCEIAWRHLTAEAQAMVQQLRQGERGTFAESCTWADDVRPDRPETSAYHFVNIPAGSAGVDLARDCSDPRTRCVVWAIKRYAELLARPGGTAQERLEALKFLSHFVGDLHQPLHAGRLADLGGNRVRVSFFGDAGDPRSPMQLHRVWDNSILRRAQLGWPQSADGLIAGLTTIAVLAWANSDVVAWTNESYRISEELVYSVADGGEVGESYYARALPVVKLRIQQAGIRLAHLLNEAARGRSAFNY